MQDYDIDEINLDSRTFINVSDINRTFTGGSYENSDNKVPITKVLIPPNPDAFRKLRPVEV